LVLLSESWQIRFWGVLWFLFLPAMSSAGPSQLKKKWNGLTSLEKRVNWTNFYSLVPTSNQSWPWTGVKPDDGRWRTGIFRSGSWLPLTADRRIPVRQQLSTGAFPFRGC